MINNEFQHIIERERFRLSQRSWFEKLKDFLWVLWRPYQHDPKKNRDYRVDMLLTASILAILVLIPIIYIVPAWQSWYIFTASLTFVFSLHLKLNQELQRAVHHESVRLNELIMEKMADGLMKSMAQRAEQRSGKPVDPNPISVTATFVDEMEAQHQKELDQLKSTPQERGLFDDFLDETDTM